MTTVPRRIGRYVVESVLGVGAAGVVYLAHDPVIDRKVAIKTLRSTPGDPVERGFRARFLREARAAGRLSHPNIVTIYDVGEDDETGPFIAMEYVEGTTLKDVLASGARYDPQRATTLAQQLARTLAHAHGQGVVHRDVKPANVILTADGGVKITDFGIARLEASELTVEGSVLGTPNYMSPEQIKGLPVDRRCDLYAVGVILFELVTGQRPFRAASLPELSISVVSQPAPDPADLCPTLPGALSAVILRCLAKDPRERFQTGLDLADSLQDVERELAAASPPAGPPAVTAAPAPSDGPVPLTPPPPAAATVALAPSSGHGPSDGDRPDDAARRAPHPPWLWPAVSGLALLLALTVGALLRSSRAVVPDPAAALAASPAGEAVAATPTSPALDSRLLVSHRNRMSEAFISLWVDGEKVWSERMTAPRSLLKRIRRVSGVPVEASIPVTAGRHTIEVHVSGVTMKVEARASIEGELPRGGSRRLRVEVNPYSDSLRLSWDD